MRLFPVNSGILFVTEPLLGLMCRRLIQQECFSDRWCLEQLPISSDEDFVFTYVLYFWYVKKKGRSGFKGYFGGGGGGKRARWSSTGKAVSVLNLQI